MVSLKELRDLDYLIDEYGVAYSADGNTVYGAVKGLFVAEEYHIKDGVKVLGANCFHCCDSVKVLYMPDSVEDDEGCYSEGCKNLQKANVSKNLKHPNIAMFCSCMSLKEVFLPEGMESIGENMFCGCTSLQEIHLPSSITCFQSDTFCSVPLRAIELPDSLETIGYDTFIGCRILETLVIPENVRSIGPWLVQCHKVFKGVVCKSSHFRIENDALITNDGDALIACWSHNPNYVVPASVKEVLSFCNDMVETIELPDHVVRIGWDAFCSCPNLKHVPES